MSARERTERLLKEFVRGAAGTTAADDERVKQLFDGIVAAVKEECCSGSQKWEVVADFFEKKEPKLIQGYTAEQWQEIIAGGYLCQVRDSEIKPWVPSELVSTDGKTKMEFIDNCGDGWQYCRPAQIKGVMRPIFVEPVDHKSFCCFFENDSQLGNGRFSWEQYKGVNMYIRKATKYIEL